MWPPQGRVERLSRTSEEVHEICSDRDGTLNA